MPDSPPANANSGTLNLAARASLSLRLQGLYAFVKTLPVFGSLARRVVTYALPRGTRVWLQVRAGFAQGLWLNLDPRFDLDFASGNYENSLQKILAEQLREGETFYDVGGHIGFISLIAARLVGESGAVFTFEADPENVARINQHILRNGFDERKRLAGGCVVRSGTLRFRRSSELSGHNQGAIVGTAADIVPGMIEVNALSLDRVWKNHKRPKLMKIDVEGGEVEVLRGAGHMLSTARPTLICEVHNQAEKEFVESYLAERQYSLTWSPGGTFPRHLLAEPVRKGS